MFRKLGLTKIVFHFHGPGVKIRKLQHAYLSKSFYKCPVFFRVQCDSVVYCRIGEDL